MSYFRSLYIEVIQPKLKFATSSSIGTALDYLIFIVLFNFIGTSSIYSHAISYSLGAITNFFLHKKFVFTLKRKVLRAFFLSISFSIFGLFLSSLILWVLLTLTHLNEWTLLAKIITSSLIFLFNYYSKQYSFEKGITKI